MTDTRPSGRTRLVAALLLWGFWTISALPFFALLYEFRCGELGECGAEWSYYARFYSHFFLYPVTFGLISTFFLHRPWTRVVHHVCSANPGVKGFIVVSILAVVGFFCYLEFTSATPAPWDLAPEFMESRDEGRRVLEIIENRCELVSEQDVMPNLSDAEKREFQENLNRLSEGDGEHRSYTLVFYRAGFVGMTLLFAFLGTTIAVPSAWRSSNRRDLEGRRMTSLVMFALIFASLWVVMRSTFIMEKRTVYLEDPLLTYNWIIFLIFLFFYGWLFITNWPGSKTLDRILSFLPSIIVILVTVIMTGDNSSRFAEWTLSYLVKGFGTGSSPRTYITVLLFLLCIICFRGIIRYLDGDGKPGSPDRPGTD